MAIKTLTFAGRMSLLITLFLVLVNIFNNVTTNSPKVGKSLDLIQGTSLAKQFEFDKSELCTISPAGVKVLRHIYCTPTHILGIQWLFITSFVRRIAIYCTRDHPKTTTTWCFSFSAEQS